MDRREFVRRAAAAAVASAATPLLSGAGASALGAMPLVDTTRWPGASNAAEGGDRLQWWREARFGMFVHWGLYAIPGGTWHRRTDYGEWIRNNAHIPREEYDSFREQWKPEAFDADAMARLAQRAGMRYLVITTKHHDGFALWPSKHGQFNVSRTGDQRDIMRLVSDACRRNGIVPCWYHSIMDWHHHDYLPRRGWEVAQRPTDGASFSRYVDFLHAQVEELLTQYGDIGVMWFDGEWESTWTRELGAALADKCRALQPHVLVNNRVAPNRAGMDDATIGAIGDFGTPEQHIPDRGLPGVDWESCVTMNGNWGFNRADHNYKSVPQLVVMLTETASKGGNLLLNIGPTASGAITPESLERLHGLAQWMDGHGDAIHGTIASPFDLPDLRATRSPMGDRVNVFLPAWPHSRELLLPGVHSLGAHAVMLGDASRTRLPVRAATNGLVVTLPDQPTNASCSVLRVSASTPLRFATA